MILNKAAALLLLLPLAAAAGGRPRVVASFSLPGDWVRQVGGADIDLTVLVGPDADVHGYEPSPADAAALARADLLVCLGGDFEPWLDRTAAAASYIGKRLEVLTPADEDPHVWGDPRRVAALLPALRDALSALDPPRAAVYARRAAAYQKDLADLDAWIARAVSAVPPARRRLVVNHDTLGAWAKRYGFAVDAVVFPSFSAETGDPSPARLAGLVRAMRSKKVDVVFIENVADDRTARAVAREAGARVAPPLYTDALSAPGTDGDTYLKMMRRNASVIAEALR